MKVVTGVMIAALAVTPVFAQKDASVRLAAATEDLSEMMSSSDKGIPRDLMAKASCVVIVPNLKSGGFVFGAQYGRGFFTCRRTSGAGWSAPGSLRLSGGKFGFLIGAKETDVIMLVMDKDGMNHLLSDKFQIGGEAAAAAGPIGRDSSAMTDAELHAEILTYSRSRGIFGGLDIGGSTVTQDEKSNHELYGRNITNEEIINGRPSVPATARPFVGRLDRISYRK